MQKLYQLCLNFAIILLALPGIRSQTGSSGASGDVFNGIGTENPENSKAPQTSTPTSTFPPSFLNTFAVDIHYLAGHDINTTHLAFHFCRSQSADFLQCDLYNGIGENATLLGVELVVSQEAFQNFPMQERELWHSHAFAIQKGIFVLPELSPQDELDVMKVLINTYGKITAFYPSSPNFPIGVPQLAFGWVTQSQVNNTILRDMDKQLNLTTTFEQRAQARSGLVAPKKIKGADNFLTTGSILQYKSFSQTVNKQTGAAPTNK